MKKILFGLFLIAMNCLGGCGYQLGSMTVGGIRTVALAPVVNQTGKSFIQEADVANSLIREFNKDGTIKVVDPSLAEAILTFKLIGYQQSAQAFTTQDVGTDFRVILTAEISIDKKDGQNLYKRQLQDQAFYSTGMDQNEIERVTVKQAIHKLSVDTVREVIQGGF